MTSKVKNDFSEAHFDIISCLFALASLKAKFRVTSSSLLNILAALFLDWLFISTWPFMYRHHRRLQFQIQEDADSPGQTG